MAVLTLKQKCEHITQKVLSQEKTSIGKVPHYGKARFRIEYSVNRGILEEHVYFIGYNFEHDVKHPIYPSPVDLLYKKQIRLVVKGFFGCKITSDILPDGENSNSLFHCIPYDIAKKWSEGDGVPRIISPIDIHGNPIT